VHDDMPLLLLLAMIYKQFPFSFAIPLRIGPLCFQARCRKRQLNLGYNLSRFFMLLYFCLMICILLILWL